MRKTKVLCESDTRMDSEQQKNKNAGNGRSQEMKKDFSDFVAIIAFTFALAACIFFAFISATSAESWYSGKHDAQCEQMDGADDCQCFQRFIKEK